MFYGDAYCGRGGIFSVFLIYSLLLYLHGETRGRDYKQCFDQSGFDFRARWMLNVLFDDR